MPAGNYLKNLALLSFLGLASTALAAEEIPADVHLWPNGAGI